MVPVQVLPLEAHHGNDGEYAYRDNLLYHLQLHERVGPSVDVGAYRVGWDEEAVFQSGHEPREEHDQRHRPRVAYVVLAQQQVAVPCECHQGVRCDEQ